MDIETKLKLSQQQGKIIGIHEGIFVRFYDQALYAWQQWVETRPSLPALKVSAKVVKKNGSQCVLSGGLPASSLAKIGVYPDKKGVISIDFCADMSNWEEWYLSHKNDLPAHGRSDLNPRLKTDNSFSKVWMPQWLVRQLDECTPDTSNPEGKLLFDVIRWTER